MESKNKLLAALIGIVLIAGCTGQGGAFLTYSNTDYGIKIGYSSDWAVNDKAEEVVVAFTSPLESEDDIFKESVNIVMNDLSGQGLDLESYTEIVIQAIATNFPDALITEAEDITIDGNPARMIVYSRQGQYGKLKFLQAWTLKDDISYIVTYAAQEEKFDTYRPTADTMISSFKISPLGVSSPTVTEETESTLTGTESEAVGRWRAFSEYIYYDEGASNILDTASTRILELKTNHRWEFGSSGGTWGVEDIADADWEKWKTGSYGPTKKIVLNGWSNGVGDGPIEETESRIDFMWIIYRAEPPTVSKPGQIQIKFGHSNS